MQAQSEDGFIGHQKGRLESGLLTDGSHLLPRTKDFAFGAAQP